MIENVVQIVKNFKAGLYIQQKTGFRPGFEFSVKKGKVAWRTVDMP